MVYKSSKKAIRKMSQHPLMRKIKQQISKKKPRSEGYPYSTYDAFEIFENEYRLDLFNLVGDNWKINRRAPIAIMWGFNDWKLGFISDYLSEYRVLFVPRKMMGVLAKLRLRKLIKNEDCRIIVWGYTDKGKLESFGKRNKVKVYRMEDAYLRSASLGASHSTPYSLVLDKTGLYYDSRKASDIENLLNFHNFGEDISLLYNAQLAMDKILGMKLSKYNEPKSVSKYLAEKIKVRKRVVVIGQVDSDMSIKYGNPNNWTSEQLVELARKENPDAEVYYRPHPEIYAGYQKSKARRKRIDQFADIIAPDEPLIDFLDTIDHVYTISSLSGFEALIRGKEVTVVGAPFYSGWGVTDDRVSIARRNRNLSVLEIFAAAYLLYPRYLSDFGSGYDGLIATCYKIQADKFILASDQTRREHSKDNKLPLSLGDVFESYFLGSTIPENAAVSFDDVGRFIQHGTDAINLIFSSIIIGKLKDKDKVVSFLRSVRNYMTSENYNDLLVLIDEALPIDTFGEIIWLLQKSVEKSLVDSVSLEYINSRVKSEFVVGGQYENHEDIRDIELLNALYYNDVNRAIKAFNRLSLVGKSSKQQLIDLVKLFESTLMAKEQRLIVEKIIKVDMRCFNKIPVALLNSCGYLDENIDIESFFLNSCILVSLKPEMYDYIVRQMEEIDRKYETTYSKVIKNLFVLCYDFSINYVNYLIEIGRFEKAKSMLYAMSKVDADNDVKIAVTYSKLCSLQGYIELSIDLLSHYLNSKYSFPVAKEYLRVLNISGRFNKSHDVISLISNKGDNIAPALKIPTLLGLNRIQEAFSLYMEFDDRLTLNRFISGKVLRSFPKINQPLFVLSAYGPGDEIRFCSLYEEINNYYDDVIFTCDYRLEKLIRRSFPKLTIIPTKRIRAISRFDGIDTHNKLPDRVLSSLMDNHLYHILQQDKDRKVLFVPDLISQFRKVKSDFKSRSIFKTDSSLVREIQGQLPKEKILIGINWRSSLSGASRNQHYLKVEELEPLFKIKNVIFVNLQYDDCCKELSYIRNQYGCNILDLENIDQYNDFDSVAALMSCLNLVIAPCTSVAELAGALGINTLLFSNTKEMEWRSRDNGKDVWFDAIQHVFPNKIGDKASLVSNLVNNVERIFLQSTHGDK